VPRRPGQREGGAAGRGERGHAQRRDDAHPSRALAARDRDVAGADARLDDLARMRLLDAHERSRRPRGRDERRSNSE
jgi:hypothetical protein